ncbi:META domain-containing protein [Pararhodobacter oceanensis]|uniref:DUF306 domain-containing protein n=1 Tax=Pararhodobacter oceanensis TaxID=2172121 RepID=A0A2T8HRX9_9RHOB|nr:META domain-containing protein [Pararhodobacter oceanensis]PVH28153.1 hypothetical protein DDE20_13645 [Pararhodobacter oceanensis]
MFFPILRAVAVALLLALPAAADTYSFQSRINGLYVGVDGAGVLSAQVGAADALVLEMVPLRGRQVAFRDPQSGRYLRAGVGQQTYLAVASPHIRGWETFEMIGSGSDIALRSVQNGLYVGTDGRATRLRAAWASRGAGQEFRITRRSGEAPQMEPQAPRQDLDFAGGWVLERLYEGGRRVALGDPALRQAQLQIGRRGGVSGDSGCNGFDARILVGSARYVVEDFLITRRRCQGETGEVERLLTRALGDAAQFNLVGAGRMEIRDASGRLRARFFRG